MCFVREISAILSRHSFPSPVKMTLCLASLILISLLSPVTPLRYLKAIFRMLLGTYNPHSPSSCWKLLCFLCFSKSWSLETLLWSWLPPAFCPQLSGPAAPSLAVLFISIPFSLFPLPILEGMVLEWGESVGYAPLQGIVNLCIDRSKLSPSLHIFLAGRFSIKSTSLSFFLPLSSATGVVAWINDGFLCRRSLLSFPL